MDVYVQGKKVRLTQADFKAQGGEGAVYVRGDTAYKVYADPAKMIPPAKIRELSVLGLDDILRPRDVLLDSARTAVGYTMRSVPDGLVLCQTFPKAFRERTGLTHEKAIHLVRKLQEGVQHVHSQGLLIVDLNEMNFLVDPRFEHVYFIDVDSYQTGSFGATALMESVRDRHATAWSQGTDWFSFAVVSFQTFVGIHPYKGKHPTIKTLEERMLQNVSVFHPDVSLPVVCPPLSAIPAAYREWYRAVLDKGERVAPPTDLNAVIVLRTPARKVAGGDHFVIRKWREYIGTVVSFAQGITVTTEAVYLHERRCAAAGADVKIGITPQSRHAVLATLEEGRVRLVDLTSQNDLPLSLTADQVMATDARLYVKQGGLLLGIDFVETPHGILPSAKRVGAVLEQATQLFEGVALQNLLGAWYASVLPEGGVCHQVRLPELDGFQVMDARFGGGVLMVVASREGRFQKFVLRFSPDYASHDVRVIGDLATFGINFVVLGHGVCLHLSDEGALEVFQARMGAAGLKVIADSALGGDCLLLKDGTQALFARDNGLYQFSMK